MAGLIERRRQAGERTFVARCEARAASNADWLLQTIAGFQQQDKPFADGDRIRFGWSILTLRRKGADWLVCEPDFTRDPVTDVREDVSLTLTIASAQGYVAGRVGVKPADCFFLDWVLVKKGSLAVPRIYMQREDPVAEGDSGWYVAPLPPPGAEPPKEDPKARLDPKNYERTPSHRLLTVRPGLLQALALPTGYFVVLDGEEIVGVVDPKGKDVWGRKGKAGA